MSNFNEVVKYLRYTRRSDEARERNTRRSASVIDFDYDYNSIPHEDDLVFVEKEKLNNSTYFRFINVIISSDTSILYLNTNSNGEIDYYVKHEDISSSEVIYRKLPYLDVEITTQGTLTPIAVGPDALYDYDEQRCIVVLAEEIFLYEDIFTYHPDDISLNNGTYTYQFDDNDGYLIEALKFIQSTNIAAQLITPNDKDVLLTKSNQAQKVNIFPNISIKNQGYVLQYNRYQKGIPNYSFLSEPAITLRFNYYGGLLSFLNSTFFYLFDSQKEDGFLESDKLLIGPLSLETKQKRIFADSYRYFVKKLLDDKQIEPLTVAFYLPQFYFTKQDKGFLWEIITSTLKSTTTNAINKNEDTVTRLIKLLATVYYKEDPDLFLSELSTRTITEVNTSFTSSLTLTKTRRAVTLIERIIANIDNDNFTDLMLFLIDLWVRSSYANLKKQRKHITNGKTKDVLNPPICGYTSGSSWSFFHENTNFDWTNDGHLALEVKTDEGVQHYKYHPLDLIAISNAENEPIPFTALKLGHISLMPAFALYAHSDVTFWKNTAIAAEYVGDVVSIAVGLGPAWRAFRIVSAVAKATGAAQKTLVIARSAVGVIEVVAGTGNIILKTSEYVKTPFGRKIARVLMWMEFASLGTEALIGIAKRLSTSSKLALANADELLKTNMAGHPLTKIELQQMSHLLLAQLEGAKYIVADDFNRIAGAIAKEIKAAGVQVLELTEDFFRSLDNLGDELLTTLGIPPRNSLGYELALANGGYLTSLNGKGFFAVDLDNLKGFFNAMSDHLKNNAGKVSRGGKTINRIDAAFQAASESIAYNRVRNGKNTDIIHNGKVIETFSSKEATETFLKNIYKNNQKLLQEIHQGLKQDYKDWLDKNNLDLLIVGKKESTRLKLIDRTTKKVVYTGLPDRIHSYLKAEQLTNLERARLRLKAYKIAQNSPQRFNLGLANKKLLEEFGLTVRRSRLGSGTVPTFRGLGRKMFLRNSKLGNGAYDEVIEEGFHLTEIESAVKKIINNKGIATNIRLTGKRSDDFNLVWDAWGIERKLGNTLYKKLDITFHHMDNVTFKYKGTFELVHSDLHDLTTSHTGNFGIFGIMLDLIK